MSDIKNGGPAFPVNSDNYAHPDSAGMTLRDYFAAKAMHGLIVEPPWGDSGIATVHSWSDGFKGSDPRDRFAFAAYKMADAMLKARETP